MARKPRKITMAFLANHFGVVRQTIANWIKAGLIMEADDKVGGKSKLWTSESFRRMKLDLKQRWKQAKALKKAK